MGEGAGKGGRITLAPPHSWNMTISDVTAKAPLCIILCRQPCLSNRTAYRQAACQIPLTMAAMQLGTMYIVW